jgi:hypothetical protein
MIDRIPGYERLGDLEYLMVLDARRANQGTEISTI